MLALVDGASSVEELADISGLGRSTTLQVLVALQRGGALR
jgi:DNA-binding IclR family transcriptional regulator